MADRSERIARPYNSTYSNGWILCFADSFVGIESSVLRINYGDNLYELWLAPERYR